MNESERKVNESLAKFHVTDFRWWLTEIMTRTKVMNAVIETRMPLDLSEVDRFFQMISPGSGACSTYGEVFRRGISARYFSANSHKRKEGRFLKSKILGNGKICLLYTSPSPRDGLLSRMPSSA